MDHRNHQCKAEQFPPWFTAIAAAVWGILAGAALKDDATTKAIGIAVARTAVLAADVIILKLKAWLDSGMPRIQPPVTATKSTARACALAVGVFSLLERVLPARVAHEELGDALEAIFLLNSTLRIYAKLASTVALCLWHTIREKSLGFFGMKKGG